MKKSRVLSLKHDRCLQSYLRLSEFVPGRHHEQGPNRNHAAPAATSTLEASEVS